MTLGPATTISPVSPAGAGVRSGRTTCTSVKKCGTPAEPALDSTCAASSSSAPGEVSVIP